MHLSKYPRGVRTFLIFAREGRLRGSTGHSATSLGVQPFRPRRPSARNRRSLFRCRSVARVRGTAAAFFGVGQAGRPTPAANAVRLPRNAGGRQSPERLARWTRQACCGSPKPASGCGPRSSISNSAPICRRVLSEMVGESGLLSRFEALRAASLTPLVGREEELELLLRRWRRAAAGEGQVVLISGEPGIGKSRLAGALRERLEGEELTRLRYFCSPHHQDSALYPFIAQLERAAGFEHEDPGEK